MTGFSKLSWLKSLRGADLNDAEFRVLVVLSTYTDKQGNQAFPGATRLAADCGMQARSIKRVMHRLEAKGYIAERTRGGNEYGHRRASVWDLVRNRPDGGVIHKGDRGDMKGDPGSHKGDPGVPNKGDSPVTPSGNDYHGIASSPEDHSAPIVAGSPTASRSNWDELRDDFDKLEVYLEEQCGPLDSHAFNLALQMWERESHPLAIHNAVLAGVSAPGKTRAS